MNSIKGKLALGLMLICLMVLLVPALPVSASAGQQQQTASTAPDFSNITAPVEQMIRKITAPLLGIVGALGSVFCIILGVKFAKAEEPQEREKAKQHLKSAIIGFSLIFILVVVLRIASPLLNDWMNDASPKKK